MFEYLSRVSTSDKLRLKVGEKLANISLSTFVVERLVPSWSLFLLRYISKALCVDLLDTLQLCEYLNAIIHLAIERAGKHRLIRAKQ